MHYKVFYMYSVWGFLCICEKTIIGHKHRHLKKVDVAFQSEIWRHCGSALKMNFICRAPDDDSCGSKNTSSPIEIYGKSLFLC